MTKVFTRYAILMLFLLSSLSLYGQVEIEGTSYSRLSLAFNAINSGTHTGDIEILITDSFTETSTAILQPSGSGSADYNSVTIYPTTTCTIQGNLSTGIIQLQGADYVTIDGRAYQSGSTRNLTIKNNSTSGPVVRIDSLTSGDPADYNKVSYCNLIGGSKTSSNVWCVSLGTSSSITGSASSTGNEIFNNSMKYAYGGVRVYSTSGREVLEAKIYGNVFGSSTLTESIAYQSLYIYYTKDIEIYDNIIEYMDYTSTMYLMYVYYSNGAQIINNTIQNVTGVSSTYPIYCVNSSDLVVSGNTINNIKTSSSVVYPFYLSSCPYSEVSNNKVSNISSQSTMYGIYNSSNSYIKILNNEFRNMTNTTSTFATIYMTSCSYSEVKGNSIIDMNTTSSSTSYGIYMSSCSYSEVDNNNIRNVNTFSPIYVIYASSCTESKYTNNLLDNISSYGSGATGALGFYILSSNSSIFVNNSVSRLKTTQYSTSGTTTNPIGFLFSSGTGYKLYYNSVNLTGKQIELGTSGSMSACLYLSSTAVNTLDIRNNNFYNDLEGAAGSRSFAIYFQSSSNLTNSTMDYNNYYVAGPYAILGYLSGNRNDLASWKSITSRESNSNSIFPDFNSSSVLAPYIGSGILGKGTPISGYNTDILGANRSGTAPTPGAYENADDIAGPDIIYNKLLTTTSFSNRTVVTTITDKTGINLSGSEPRLYYRKTSTDNTYNGNTNTSSGWKYSTATQNGDEFTFILDYDKIQGGVTIGDVIEYFILAQDLSTNQNISITSGSFTSYPTSTNLTASNFPVVNVDNFKLAASVVGNINVGSNQTYTSLTGANGLFNHMNNNVISGEVNIYITSNLSESGEIALGNLTYENGSYHKINIRPNTDTERIISGDVASGAVIKIIGADNVNIDGSYDGEGRYLSFTNTSTSGTRAVVMLGTNGGSGGNDLTIQNCNIYNSSTSSTTIALLTSDGTVTTAPSVINMNNLTIKNNHIYRTQYGMIVRGNTSSGSHMYNLLIEGNELGDDATSSQVYQYGIDVQNAPEGRILRNKIYNMVNSASNKWAIQLGGTTTSPAGITVEGNTIQKIHYNSTGGWGAYGINLIGGNNHSIINNFISDIKTDRYSNTSNIYNPFGIRIQSGSGHKIWHNTIIMTGTQLATNSSASFTSNILYTSSYTNMDIRGNILHNSLQGISGTMSYNIYLWSSSVGSAFAQLDHNLYSVGGAAGIYAGVGTSPTSASNYYSLAQWRSATGRDVNSKEGYPSVIDPESNVHLDGGVIGNSYYMYGGIGEVSEDGDGEMRNSPTYYGADEVNPIFEIVEDTKIAPSSPTICVDEPVTVYANPNVERFGDGIERTGLSAISVQWYKNDEPIFGANDRYLNFNPVTMNDSARYYIVGTFLDETIKSKEVLLKVETPIDFSMQPTSHDVCSDSPSLVLPSQATGTFFSVQWEFRKSGTSTWIDFPGAIEQTLVIDEVRSDETVGDYRLRVMGPGNCGPATVYSDVVNVSLSDPLHSVLMTPIEKSVGKDLYYTCVDEDLAFEVTDEGTVFGYRWQRDEGNGYVDLSTAQYPDAHSSILRITGAHPSESGKYRCKVLGSASCGTAEIFSNEFDVRIWPYFSLDEQPQSQTLCEGENSFIRVNISGTVYSYQWFKDGNMITSEESEFYDKPVFYFTDADFSDGGVYQCRVQAEDCFGYLDFISNPASIHVSVGTDITQSPFTQAVVPGNSVTFRVKAHANGTPLGERPEVQWYRGNQPLHDGGRFIGTKSDILNIINVTEEDFGDDYRVVVTGHCGSAEVSNFGLVKGEVVVVEQPVGADVCEDETVVLRVRAESTVPNSYLTYQWFKDGEKLNDGDEL
ncbi:MAG: right-handed parallel beta-helix repeat-containing protein, partial [Candidatus Kapaibacterium sp.]